MTQNKDILGQRGEELAKCYLLEQNFQILHQNWRHGHKELDIVACKGNVLHVVEVKTRTSGYCEEEIHEAVGRRKQRHVIDAAEAYILTFDINMDTQFDVIFIVYEGNDQKHLEYIPNAFGAYE